MRRMIGSSRSDRLDASYQRRERRTLPQLDQHVQVVWHQHPAQQPRTIPEAFLFELRRYRGCRGPIEEMPIALMAYGSDEIALARQ